MTGKTKTQFGTQVELRLQNRLADIIRHAVQDEFPVEATRHVQIWETAVSYHGELYGMDTLIENILADSSKLTLLLQSIFSGQSSDYTVEAEKKDQESPPKIILRIHKWKRNP